MEYGQCISGSSCQTNAMNYQLTFVDDVTPDPSDQYCYGDGAATMPMPAGASTYGWDSCCWVPLTDDNGQGFGSWEMKQYMTINDWSNTSPTFKLPPIWLIMAGCDAQTISLSPVDADGDAVAGAKPATHVLAADAVAPRVAVGAERADAPL